MKLLDVLGTSQLASRVASTANRRRARARALSTLDASALTPIESFAERARIGCGAQSSGISIFRQADRGESKWIVATGLLSDYLGRRFPLRHSLCGVASELRATQLFIKPHRYFKWIEQSGVFISEALVTPLAAPDERCFGTIWVMCHRGSRKRFDMDDVHHLEDLARQTQFELWPPFAAEPTLF